MTELWYVLLREPVESPALEIFKLHLDTILCNMFWVTLLGRGLGPDDLQRSLATSAVL